jgi:hypothetical protein
VTEKCKDSIPDGTMSAQEAFGGIGWLVAEQHNHLFPFSATITTKHPQMQT